MLARSVRSKPILTLDTLKTTNSWGRRRRRDTTAAGEQSKLSNLTELHREIIVESMKSNGPEPIRHGLHSALEGEFLVRISFTFFCLFSSFLDYGEVSNQS